MKKRTCGTCRYFQDSDISGCGWCTHPQRRVTTDLKIMVRRGELACRDGWSRDLWAPAGEMAPSSDPEPLRTGPVAPVTVEEMTQLVSAKYVTLEPTSKSQPPAPVDVVVGETPAMPVNDDRATLLSHDPRAAIEAARKRHLANLQGAAPEESSEPQTPLNRSGDYTSSRTPFVSSGVDSQATPIPETPSRPIPPRFEPEVAPVGRDEIQRDRSGLVSFRADEEQFSSIPDVADDARLPRREDSMRIAKIAGESIEHDVEIAPTAVKAPSRWPFERAEHETDVTAFGANLVPESDHAVEPSVPETAYEYELGVEAFEALDEQEPLYDPEPHYEPAPRRRWQPNFRFERPTRKRDYQPQFDEWEEDYDYAEVQVIDPDPVESDYASVDPAFAWQEQVDRIEMTIEASPTVPRMCRTCRDFRPADNGGRGWCTNKWAFSHRRMVDADELPCETSLGCWWLPHDEVWLSEADAAAHTEPTPLVDRWLGRQVSVSAASGTRRR